MGEKITNILLNEESKEQNKKFCLDKHSQQMKLNKNKIHFKMNMPNKISSID